MDALGQNALTTQIRNAASDACTGTVIKAGAAVKANAAAMSDAREAKAEKAAKDFESVFVSEMIKPMFDMIDVDDTFGGGKGEEVFRGMMVQEYGKMITAQGGIGIADRVKAELLREQEKASGQSGVTGGSLAGMPAAPTTSIDPNQFQTEQGEF